MASNSVDRLNKVLDTLASDNISKVAYTEFVRRTPVGNPALWKNKKAPKNYRPGNARRSTELRNNNIEANYPYAQRLEEGWSKQAPKGMTDPTYEAIRDYVYKTLGIRI